MTTIASHRRESVQPRPGTPSMTTPTIHRWSTLPSLPRAHYEVDVSWDSVELHLERWSKTFDVSIDPDFQRCHVWTEDQQRAYVEYTLTGGEVGKHIMWNCPEWSDNRGGSSMTLVDGKQRLEAVRRFMRGDLKCHGMKYREGERLDMFKAGMKWRVCVLKTRAELLRLYLNINAGGTPHTPEELDRVRAMLDQRRDCAVAPNVAT